MYFHLILTEKCNSQCRYCYEKSEKEFGNKLTDKFKFDFSAPCDSEIDVKQLRKFILKDKEPKIIFYGGEPLLNITKIKEIIDAIPESKYYIQTNGKLLNNLPKEYTNRFSKILISIDGDKKRTDFNRGRGTYDLILKNLNLIRRKGFKGEIVARMTISFSDKFTDLTKQVKHLLKIGFSSIHWQLDMGFYEFDYNKKEVENFIKKYNKEISKLIRLWIKNMNRGKVLKIYPFLGIFDSLYHNTSTKLRCGSGYANYTISTDGKIIACPITNCIKDFEIGHIKTNTPNKLKEISVIEPCPSCSYFSLCGGRCLYSNYAKLWPLEGEKQICFTIRYLIDELKKSLPQIRKLIQKEVVNEKQFEYEKYFGPEIIP
jgi:putative peptide-modifying radical SAM enzyme